MKGLSNFFSRELSLAFALAPIYIVLGMIITYPILAILLGDLAAPFAVVLFSVICTAGIGLIVWFPLWYIIGFIFVIVARAIAKFAGIELGRGFSKKKQADQKSPKVKLSKDQLALTNYIKKAQAKGLSRDQIVHNLSTNGWTQDSISAGFRWVESGS